MPTVSAHCVKCYGSGTVRKRNMIGMISYINCKHCNGLGRRHVEWGSGEHRIAASIGALGFGPGIRSGVDEETRHAYHS